MRSLRPLAMTLSAFTMAVGGIAVGAGTASATYSACLDTVAENGGEAGRDTVEKACVDAAQGRLAECERSLQLVGNGREGDEYPGLSKAVAQLACKRAAVPVAP